MKDKKKHLIGVGLLGMIALFMWMTGLDRAIYNYLRYGDSSFVGRMIGGKSDSGYVVTFSEDEMYRIEDFMYKGQFSDFHVVEGFLIPGTTEVGTTVVVILGAGEWSVLQPEGYQWGRHGKGEWAVKAGKVLWDRKNAQPKNGPFKESFSSIYMRIHPEFYETLIAGTVLEKTHNAGVFKAAEKIYKHKFWNSFHINERAMIPSSDIGVIDIESETWGRLQVNENRHVLGSLIIPPRVRQWDYLGDPPGYMN